MANGTYGIKKPSTIRPEEAEVFYHYRPTRGSESADFREFKRLESSDVLSTTSFSGSTLPGMYNLRLPLDIFGKPGIYTIYIKPREIEARILDVSTLAGSYSGVRGIVIDSSVLDEIGESGAGSLVGYRVEYQSGISGARENYYRIITSNNFCVPVSQRADSTIGNGVKYRLDNGASGGGIMFCTLSPSSSMSFNVNSYPVIGRVNQSIYLINTKFNPVMLEVEMVEHDEESIATMLEGPQIRDLDHGVITTFDKSGNIYHQAAYGNITNVENGMHCDFKLPYEDVYIRSEENRLREIKEQVNV